MARLGPCNSQLKDGEEGDAARCDSAPPIQFTGLGPRAPGTRSERTRGASCNDHSRAHSTL